MKRFVFSSAATVEPDRQGRVLLPPHLVAHAGLDKEVVLAGVSDHLEIMYDIDYEARRKADSLGMTLRRTRMPNADPGFVRVLAAVVAAAPPLAPAETAHAAASSGH